MGLTGVQLDRAHRRFRRRGPNVVVDIVAHFPNYLDRDAILSNRRKLKGTNIFVNEQLSKRMNYIQFKLREKLRADANEEVKGYVRYDKLLLGNRVYIYDDLTDSVVEQTRRNAEEGRSVSTSQRSLGND